MTHVVLPEQQTTGWPNPSAQQYPKGDIEDILLKKHANDAHFTSYEVHDDVGAYRYNYAIFSHKKFAGKVVQMRLIVFEADCPGKNSTEPGVIDDWWERERGKVEELLTEHSGGLAWRTKGGYRVCWLTDRKIGTLDQAGLWRKEYLSSICYFARRFDITFDHMCGEWNRLQRVPFGTREGEDGPTVREMIGSLSGTFDSGTVPAAEDIKLSKKVHSSAWKVARPKNDAVADSPCDTVDIQGISVAGVWERLLSSRGWLGDKIGANKWIVRCPNDAAHTSTSRSGTVLYAPGAGEIFGHPHCSHSHCMSLDWRDSFTGEEWAKAVEETKAAIGPIIGVEPESELVPAGTVWADGDDDAKVISKLICKDNNPTQPAGISHNVSLLLTGMKQWRGKLVYDNYKHDHFWDQVPPELEREHKYDKRVLPADYSYIQAWLLQGGGGWHGARPKLNASIEAVRAGVQAACAVNTVDSLVEHVNCHAGKWDGVLRLDTWLPRYMGADDTPLNRAIGARMLMAAAKRALEPGCLADMMPIFEGRQGIGKGYVLDILFGPEWITIPYGLKLGSKDFEQKCSDAWIVHDDELASMLKAGLEATKSWLTQRTAKYRMAYAEQFIDVKRRFLVIGSTNPKKYLDDDENRRFWPVLVTRLDEGGLAKIRDQLWAEALDRLTLGDTYFIRPSDDVWDALQITHAAKKAEDALAGAVQKLLDQRLVETPCRLVDVMLGLGMPAHQLADKKLSMTVAEAMRKIGLVNRIERHGDLRGMYWRWPEN